MYWKHVVLCQRSDGHRYGSREVLQLSSLQPLKHCSTRPCRVGISTWHFALDSGLSVITRELGLQHRREHQIHLHAVWVQPAAIYWSALTYVSAHWLSSARYWLTWSNSCSIYDDILVTMCVPVRNSLPIAEIIHPCWFLASCFKSSHLLEHSSLGWHPWSFISQGGSNPEDRFDELATVKHLFLWFLPRKPVHGVLPTARQGMLAAKCIFWLFCSSQV